MAITRQGGTLFDETDETLRGRLEQMGMEGSAVTDQATAQALGASPDSTKMIGTKAQKTPVLQAQVAKENTLAGATALDQGRQQALPAEQAAMLKAQQLQQLGSLSMRVQDLVESRIQGIGAADIGQAQTPTSLMAETLGMLEYEVTRDLALPETKTAKIQAQLLNLSLNPTGIKAEQALQALFYLGVDETQASRMIDTSAQATGKTAAANLQNTVTLGELDFTQMGFESVDQVAEMLGITPTELSAMKLPEFHEKVSEIQFQDYDKAAELKAKLATLPKGSAQRAVIQQQLKDLGQVGVTVMEHSIAQTAQEIDRADQVKIGEHTYSVDELLEDDKISAMVIDYIYASDAEKEIMFPAEKFGDLRSWIDSNQMALADISRGLGETSQAFVQTQSDWQSVGNLPGGASLDADTLAAMGIGYDPNAVVTSAGLASMQDAITNSGIGQAITTGDSAVGKRIAGKLNPEYAAQLKDLSVLQIQDADKYGEMSNDAILAALAGLPIGSEFIIDPAVQEDLDIAKSVLETLQANGDTDWMTNPDFMAMSPKQRQVLTQNPDRYDEFTEFHDTQRRVTHMGDNPTMEQVLQVLLQDDTVPMDQIASEYAKLSQLAKLGDPKAKATFDKWKALLEGPEGNGVLDEADAKTLMDRVKSGLSGVTIDQVIGDTDTMDATGKTLRDQLESLFSDMDAISDAKIDSIYEPSGIYGTVNMAMGDDGVLDQTEFLTSLSEEERASFLSTVAPNLGPGELEKYQGYEDTAQQAKATKDISGILKSKPDGVRAWESANHSIQAVSNMGGKDREAYARAHPIDQIDTQIASVQGIADALDLLIFQSDSPAHKAALQNELDKWKRKVSSLQSYKTWQNSTPPPTTKEQSSLGTDLLGNSYY